MNTLFPSLADAAFTSVKTRLDGLGAAPAQVLLLEGGSEAERTETAFYWACRLACPEAEQTGVPCLACPTCRTIAAREALDVLAFDGRISNKEDEENPGPVRALNVDNVRHLKSILRDPPHWNAPRIVMLSGIEGKRDGAANALLKALEEPSPTSVFVLLAQQREQLLPTLVSRSLCLTLPWPDPEAFSPEQEPVRKLLADFLKTGRNLFAVTGAKGYDLPQARQLLLAVQKALIRIMAGNNPTPGSLEEALFRLSDADRMQACRWIIEAQDALALTVTPARVCEAFCANLFVLTTRSHR